MTTIWFIRHTESRSNVGKRTLCPRLTGLTERGTRQAKCITNFFPQPPSLIITSKYKRAQLTAQPTRDRFPFVPCEEREDLHEFTYLSEPHSSCMSVQDRRPLVETFWESCDPSYVDGEGAESFNQFTTRVYTVLEQLRTRKEDFIAVFTHGQFMRAVWWLLYDPPSRLDSDSMKYFRNLLTEIPIPNGAILPVRFLSSIETWIGNIMIPRWNEEDEEHPLETILNTREQPSRCSNSSMMRAASLFHL